MATNVKKLPVLNSKMEDEIFKAEQLDESKVISFLSLVAEYNEIASGIFYETAYRPYFSSEQRIIEECSEETITLYEHKIGFKPKARREFIQANRLKSYDPNLLKDINKSKIHNIVFIMKAHADDAIVITEAEYQAELKAKALAAQERRRKEALAEQKRQKKIRDEQKKEAERQRLEFIYSSPELLKTYQKLNLLKSEAEEHTTLLEKALTIAKSNQSIELKIKVAQLKSIPKLSKKDFKTALEACRAEQKAKVIAAEQALNRHKLLTDNQIRGDEYKLEQAFLAEKAKIEQAKAQKEKSLFQKIFSW